MPIAAVLLTLVLCYLFGSISIARLAARILAPGVDLEQVSLPDRSTGGTFTLKNTGATTASVLLGPRVGGMIGLLDIVKGLLPCLAARLLFPEQSLYLWAGVATVAGHIWPVYHRFRGGGGLSPALGVFLVIDPLGLLVCVLAAMLLGLFVFKEIIVVVMGGNLLLLPWVWLRSGDLPAVAAILAVNVLLVLAVLPDIRVQLRARKLGKTDLSTSMDVIPMGRMMKKMMLRMGLTPDKSATADEDLPPPQA